MKTPFSTKTRATLAGALVVMLAISASSCSNSGKTDKAKAAKPAPLKEEVLSLPNGDLSAVESSDGCLSLEKAAGANRPSIGNAEISDSLSKEQINSAIKDGPNGDILFAKHMLYTYKKNGGKNSEWYAKESVKRLISSSTPSSDVFFGVTTDKAMAGERIAMATAFLAEYTSIFEDKNAEALLIEALEAMVAHPSMDKPSDGDPEQEMFDFYTNSLLATSLHKSSVSSGLGTLGDSAKEAVSRISAEAEKSKPDTLRAAAAVLAAYADDYEGTGDTLRLEDAERFAMDMIKRFWNEDAGAFASAANKQPLFCPRDNAMAAEALARVYHLSGETAFNDKARKAMTLFSSKWQGPYFAMTLHRISVHPLKATVIGDKSNPATDALRAAVAAFYEPDKTVETLDPVDDQERLAKLPYRAQDVPTLYACVETACSMPVTDPGAVPSHLKKFVDKYLYGDRTDSMSGKLINNRPSGGGAMFQKP